jgi:hypothetical protein
MVIISKLNDISDRLKVLPKRMYLDKEKYNPHNIGYIIPTAVYKNIRGCCHRIRFS